MRNLLGRALVCVVWPLSLAMGCGGQGDEDDSNRASASTEEGEDYESDIGKPNCKSLLDEDPRDWVEEMTFTYGGCKVTLSNIKKTSLDANDRAGVVADIRPESTTTKKVSLDGGFTVGSHGSTLAEFTDLTILKASYKNGERIPTRARLSYHELSKSEQYLVLEKTNEPVTLHFTNSNLTITLLTELTDSTREIKLKLYQKLIAGYSSGSPAITNSFRNLDYMWNGPCKLLYEAKPNAPDEKTKEFIDDAQFCLISAEE